MTQDIESVYKIIGLFGKSRSGKDSVANVLCWKFGFIPIAVSDPMKKFVMEIFKLTPEQTWGEKKTSTDNYYKIDVIKALQTLGTEWIEGIVDRPTAQSIWIDIAITRAKRILSHCDDPLKLWHYSRGNLCSKIDGRTVKEMEVKGVVFTDLRWEENLKAVRKVGRVWMVTRREAASIVQKQHASHQSEQHFPSESDVDYVIRNDGTLEDLADQVVKAYYS